MTAKKRRLKHALLATGKYASDDPSEKQACRQVKTLISCIKEGLKNCGSGNDLMDEDFAELESLFENCAAEHELTVDSRECFKNNENYISACLADTTADMVELAKAFEEDVDENIMLCLTFTATVDCATNRISEKCGSETTRKFEEVFGEVPEEVQKACFAESTLEFLAKLFLEEMKKRR